MPCTPRHSEPCSERCSKWRPKLRAASERKAEVGGYFALRGAVEGDFIGENLESWHIIAIGQYPRRESFLELLSDQDYKKAFRYRQAAVESQNVFFINAM